MEDVYYVFLKVPYYTTFIEAMFLTNHMLLYLVANPEMRKVHPLLFYLTHFSETVC